MFICKISGCNKQHMQNLSSYVKKPKKPKNKQTKKKALLISDTGYSHMNTLKHMLLGYDHKFNTSLIY